VKGWLLGFSSGLTVVAMLLAVGMLVTPVPAAAQAAKPNILFIMGDDIGWTQVGVYHRGIGLGETPNIDRLAHEGATFSTYYAMQSCTSGRNVFFTGMYPLRTGMIPPQLPGSPTYLKPGTPALAKFLLDLGYNTGQFGRNHLGDHTAALPAAHGFQEYWGYLYHLDAMQGVSFPDINKSPTQQGVAPPCKNTPIPGVPEVPGAVDPRTTVCLTPPRNVLWCKSSDGSEKNQTCKDEGPLTLDRPRTVDEEISAKVIDFLDRNDPKKTNKPFFVWYNPARMHVTTMLRPKYEAMLGERGGKDWGVNATPSAVRYKNWKMYYNMSQPGPAGWILPLVPFHFTLVQNVRRDPFEQAVGIDQKTALSIGGALAARATAFIYDWNLLPIGQQLWLHWFETLQKVPPLQATGELQPHPGDGPAQGRRRQTSERLA